MRLVLELDGPVAAGGELGGRVVVAAGGAQRLLQVAVRLCEHSRDYHEEITYASVTLVRDTELRSGDTFPFTLAVPAHAGPAVHTEWGGLAWEVRAWADVALRQDPEVAQPLPLG